MNGKGIFVVTAWAYHSPEDVAFFEDLDDAIAYIRNEWSLEEDGEGFWHDRAAEHLFYCGDIKIFYEENGRDTSIYLIDEDGDKMDLLYIDEVFLQTSSKKEDDSK